MFVHKAAVVGAGAIGAEIAHAIAGAAIPVVLKDVEQSRVESGLERARALWQGRVDAGKMQSSELDRNMALITGTTDYDLFGDADLVIEAVPDEVELKRTVFAELDQATPGHAILATSTSTLSITEIGETTSRPDKVVGLHFFDPVSVVRVVEVIEGADTSPETLQAASNFAQAIRKVAIRALDGPGFVVGRVLSAAAAELSPDAAQAAAASGELDRVAAECKAAPGGRVTLRALVESCLVLEEGVASMRDIDLGMLAAGLPAPFAGADQVGLDEVLAKLERAADEWGEGFEPPMILRRLVAQGRLGVGSGQGFWPYPKPDPGWEDAPVKLESRSPVAIAWLDRPPANSISPEVVAALHQLWDAVTAQPRIRTLIFASSSPTLFCAGADIKAFTQMDAAASAAFIGGMHELLLELEHSRVVTIAAVNGLAFGGGCELAMGCDLRIAADSATFGQPEITLGLIPGFGGTQRLARLVGASAALEMNLTGDPIDAARGFELGLVTRVVPDHELLDEALRWARKLSAQAPLATEQIKRVSKPGDHERGLEAERQAFASVFASADGQEGLWAFVQKRPPRFEGR